MKNTIKIIFLLFLGLTLLNSCDNKLEDTDYLENRKPFLQFNKSEDIFFIKMDEENIYNIKIKLSAPANENTTYTLTRNAASNAIENVDYTFVNSTTTISAGEQFIEFAINGDFDNASIDGKKLILDLSSIDNVQIGVNSEFELTLLKFCPIEADFTGSYTITRVSGGLGGFFNETAIWGDGTVVELSMGTIETERTFEASYYPALIDRDALEVSFSLICGETIMNNNFGNVNCTAGVYLDVSASTTGNATYDPLDDSTFNIIFTENAIETCGQPSVITVMKFTKN